MNDRPAEDIVLALLREDPRKRFLSRSGPGGHYLFKGITAGLHLLKAMDPALEHWEQSFHLHSDEIFIEEDQVLEHDVRLFTTRVFGRVVDNETGDTMVPSKGERSRPVWRIEHTGTVPRCGAMLSRKGGTGRHSVKRAISSLDEKGTFFFRRVKPGTYRLEVLIPGYNIASLPVTVAGEEQEIIVRAEIKPMTLSGAVIDFETGEPVSDVTVRVHGRALSTDKDGKFFGCFSPMTMTWSRHSRRIDPIT